MATRVAINGFGRIGRLAFRQMYGVEGYDIVAVNDLTNAKMLAHLLKYDTSQGKYGRHVTHADNEIIVDGNPIRIYAEKDPRNLPWKALGVDVVLECTGFFTSRAKAAAHVEAGARKVVISAVAGNDMPTIVFGVNERTLTAADDIISAASCTTNCVALMANVLNNLCPVKKGFMSTIHAYTNDQMTLDGPHAKGDLRRARSAAANILPTSTGAGAVGMAIPALAGKLDGVSYRVPVIAGSIVELTAVVEGSVDIDTVNRAMRDAASDSFGYTEEELVSSDIIGMEFGALLDATQTKATPLGEDTLVKIAAWYDNENSYTSQMVRTIKYFSELK